MKLWGRWYVLGTTNCPYRLFSRYLHLESHLNKGYKLRLPIPGQLLVTYMWFIHCRMADLQHWWDVTRIISFPILAWNAAPLEHMSEFSNELDCKILREQLWGEACSSKKHPQQRWESMLAVIGNLCCTHSTFTEKKTEAQRSYVLSFDIHNCLNTKWSQKTHFLSTVHHAFVPQTLNEQLPWAKHLSDATEKWTETVPWRGVQPSGADGQEPGDKHCCVLLLLLLLPQLSSFFGSRSDCYLASEQLHFSIPFWLPEHCVLHQNEAPLIFVGDSSDLSEGHKLWAVFLVVVMSLHADVDTNSVRLITKDAFQKHKLKNIEKLTQFGA